MLGMPCGGKGPTMMKPKIVFKKRPTKRNIIGEKMVKKEFKTRVKGRNRKELKAPQKKTFTGVKTTAGP